MLFLLPAAASAVPIQQCGSLQSRPLYTSDTDNGHGVVL